MKKLILLIGLLFYFHILWAQTFLETVENRFFESSTAPRIGLEIELTGITQQEMGDILQKELGGRLEWKEILEDNLDSKTGKYETYTVHELHLVDSLMKKNVVIKPEDNVTENANIGELKAKTRVYEIVTPPIRYWQAIPLQKALDNLKLQGAQGTLEGHAVAIQINVEMGGGDSKKITAQKIISILRNYLRSENRQAIAAELMVPEFRKMFLGDYSEGMMRRIMDTSYRPTNAQFFFDFMYRQSLEVLGEPRAWQMKESEARKTLRRILKKQPFDGLLPVVKWNYIRTSAVLMFLYPNDWLSRYLIKTTWFHKYPILEFRETNSDFQLLKRIRQFLGLVQYSEAKGDLVWSRESQSLSDVTSIRCSLLF
jgi:hypothetical protein